MFRKPKVGDSVYYRGWEQPNGYITSILYIEEEDVLEITAVSYGNSDSSIFTEDEFEYTWTDKFGGVWLLDEPPTPEELMKYVLIRPKIVIKNRHLAFRRPLPST